MTTRVFSLAFAGDVKVATGRSVVERAVTSKLLFSWPSAPIEEKNSKYLLHPSPQYSERNASWCSPEHVTVVNIYFYVCSPVVFTIYLFILFHQLLLNSICRKYSFTTSAR
jgi:hypothetical protein